MPEGPEIHREADRIRSAIGGVRASSVWFAFPHLKPWSKRLRGRVVHSVTPRGKAMLIQVGPDLHIYSHNQLYGRWMIRSRGSLPKTGRQLRLALHTDRHSALLYSASEITVLRGSELSSHPFLAKLGPDVLCDEVGVAEVLAQLKDRRFHRRSLGGLLLDQRFLGGLGNYLRSEILFIAQLAPEQRPRDLSDARLAALAGTILDVTRQSYRTGGITNDLEHARRLRSDGARRREYRHWVFARGGKPCRVCRDPVIRIQHAGRRLYVCQKCQLG